MSKAYELYKENLEKLGNQVNLEKYQIHGLCLGFYCKSLFEALKEEYADKLDNPEPFLEAINRSYEPIVQTTVTSGSYIKKFYVIHTQKETNAIDKLNHRTISDLFEYFKKSDLDADLSRMIKLLRTEFKHGNTAEPFSMFLQQLLYEALDTKKSKNTDDYYKIVLMLIFFTAYNFREKIEKEGLHVR